MALIPMRRGTLGANCEGPIGRKQFTSIYIVPLKDGEVGVLQIGNEHMAWTMRDAEGWLRDCLKSREQP